MVLTCILLRYSFEFQKFEIDLNNKILTSSTAGYSCQHWAMTMLSSAQSQILLKFN